MRKTDFIFHFRQNSKSSLRGSHQFTYIAHHADATTTTLTTTPNTTLATATQVRT